MADEQDSTARRLDLGGNGGDTYRAPHFMGFRYSKADKPRIIVGTSSAMHEVFEKLERVAKDPYASVLVVGESGTGKQLVADAVHYTGSRAKKPYVDLNCTAIPQDLLESELFGHIKGAFTGAVRDRKGMFELADKGTIFLDEIHSLSFATQGKLLKAVDGGYIRPVGYDGIEPKEVDVRVVAATQKDLNQMALNGEFRRDLLYRLSVCVIRIPSLQERGEQDLVLLAQYFLDQYCQTRGVRKLFSVDGLQALKKYSWPGNVREL